MTAQLRLEVIPDPLVDLRFEHPEGRVSRIEAGQPVEGLDGLVVSTQTGLDHGPREEGIGVVGIVRETVLAPSEHLANLLQTSFIGPVAARDAGLVLHGGPALETTRRLDPVGGKGPRDQRRLRFLSNREPHERGFQGEIVLLGLPPLRPYGHLPGGAHLGAFSMKPNDPVGHTLKALQDVRRDQFRIEHEYRLVIRPNRLPRECLGQIQGPLLAEPRGVGQELQEREAEAVLGIEEPA